MSAQPVEPTSVDPRVGQAPAPPDGPLSVQRLLDGPGFNVLRLVLDSVMLVLASVVAGLGAGEAGVSTTHDAVLFAFPPLAVALLAARGMYRTQLRTEILDGIAPVVGAISIAAMALVAIEALQAPDRVPAGLLTRAWAFAVVYVGGGRILLVLSQRRARARGILSKPALIVGAGVVGAHIARRLEEAPDYGLRPVGFLDADPAPAVDVVDRRAPILGGPEDFDQVVVDHGVRHVVLSFSRASDESLLPLVRRCEELGIEITIVPRLFDLVNERVELEHLGGLPLIGMRSVNPKGAQFAVKHAFDRIAAGLGLLFLAPLLGAVTLAVRLTSPGPILFRQRRVGRDGRVFDLFKFRSMSLADEPDKFVPSEGSAPGGVEGQDRRTGIGKLMRRTAIDELPQLVNVLKGEMSLVGPRPERPEFVSMFERDIRRYQDRHRVRSGLTGWAQVNGYRGQTSLADRVEWDNYYIENWTLWLDLKILLLTVVTVFRASE